VGLLLIIFVGFFSLGMLTAWRGLFLTSGGLLLVGTFMLLYARRSTVPEAEASARQVGSDDEPSEPGEACVEPTDSELVVKTEPEAVLAEPEVPTEPVAMPIDHHCPFCARALEADYAFCPSCGQDTSQVHRCEHCGHQQFVPEGVEAVYCVRCGEVMGE
jgi:hypothetical protein